MNLKIMNLIRKNLLILNISIILFASIFYYSNYNKFDTYISYKTYDFESRKSLFLSIDSLNRMKIDLIDTYLSDIHFSKSSYDKEDIFFGGKNRKFTTIINRDEKKLEFTFSTKKKGLFINPENSSSDLNNKQINDFVIRSLDVYHEKLLNIFLEKNRAFDKRLNEILNIEDLNTRIILSNEVLSAKLPVEQYITLLRNGNKLIMIKGYDSKFRRLFLNTDEFLISSFILLILINLLVRNYNKILK